MLQKISCDIGMNNDTRFPTIRFSNDGGKSYFYVGFGSLEEFNQFVGKVNYVSLILNSNTNQSLI